ncbi:MAG: tRNA (cytidine(34)-2'-O)-methyltransferase, partial [Candidatus Sericytochromatia bacterium]
MALNVVLVTPQIPQNTGNIARLCAVTNANLHLIEPLGFVITDKHLKRAGLDYWEHINVIKHKSLEYFLENHDTSRMFFLSSKVKKSYWSTEFKDGDYLVFGSETTGIPIEVREKYFDNFLTIPQFNEETRCLNLSNSVGIVL